MSEPSPLRLSRIIVFAVSASLLACATGASVPSEGVAPARSGRCHHAHDREADGVIDTRTADHFQDGLRTKREIDLGADGSIDATIVYTYDTERRRTGLVRDSEADGTPDWVVTYVWDARGHLARVETDRGGDGTVFSFERYSYDAAGRLTGLDLDEPGARTFFQITYDDAGHEALREVLRDGVVDWRIAFERDAAGRRIGMSWDGARVPRKPEQRADGTVDSRATFALDGAGRLLMWTSIEGDGPPHKVREHSYDAAGNRVREIWYARDDGRKEDCTTWSWDAAGQEVGWTRDRDCDGMVDGKDTSSTSRYDAAGRLVERIMGRGPDHRPSTIDRWTYEGDVPAGECERDTGEPERPIAPQSFGAV